MSTSRFPDIPEGCRAELKELPTGLVIQLRHQPWWELSFLCMVACCWLFCLLLQLHAWSTPSTKISHFSTDSSLKRVEVPAWSWERLQELGGGICCCQLPLIFLVGLALIRFCNRTRSAVIELGAEQLQIRTTGVFGPQGVRCPRAHIRSVAAWDGLRIGSTTGKQFTLLRNQPLSELLWVAEVLQTALALPDPWLPGPHEVAVTFTGTFWDRPIKGMLAARSGELALRHPTAAKPFLVFRTSSRWPSLWRSQLIFCLAAEDLGCRIAPDGSAEVYITPENATCHITTEEKYLIRVAVIPWVLSDNHALRAGWVQKRKLTKEDKHFFLCLTCADGEGTQRALARFWGSPE